MSKESNRDFMPCSKSFKSVREELEVFVFDDSIYGIFNDLI